MVLASVYSAADGKLGGLLAGGSKEQRLSPYGAISPLTFMTWLTSPDMPRPRLAFSAQSFLDAGLVQRS